MKFVFLGRLQALMNCDPGHPPDHVRTVSDLEEWLSQIEPAFGHAMKNARARIVVNQTVIHDPQYRLSDEDEVAFLPPMSGG